MSYLEAELYALVQKDHKIFNFIQNLALDGLWYWDLENGEDEWMSPKFWTTLGYDPTKMPHKASAWKNIIHENDLELVNKGFIQHRDHPEIPYDLVVRCRHFQGHTVWIRSRGMIIRDDAGKPWRMLGAHTDVTSLKKKEVLLESCNAAAKIGFWEIDFMTNEMTWSEETRRIHGVEKDYKPSIENGIGFYEEGWSRDKIKEIFAHSIATMSDYDVELKLVTSQGQPLWVRAIGSPVADGNGQCIRMYGTFQDIHDRKMAQLQLEKEKRIADNIIESTGVGTWEGKYFDDEVIINERFAEMLGYTKKELPSDTKSLWRLFLHKDHEELILDQLRQCVSGEKEVFEIDTLFRHKAGFYKWVKLRAKYFFNPEGEDKLFYGTIRDINEERSLLLKQGAFITQSPTAIALLDAQLNILSSSEKWNSLFGIQREINSGTDIKTIVDPTFNSLFSELQLSLDHNQAREGEDVFLLKKKDNPISIKWNMKPWSISASGDHGVIMYVEDTTEERRIQEEIVLSESRFRGSFEMAGVGMTLINLKGKFERVNDKFCEIMDYEIGEMLNMSFQEIVHEDDLSAVSALFKQFGRGEINQFRKEIRFRNKDNSVVYAILVLSNILSKDGSPQSVVAQVIDITALKQSQLELAAALAKNEVVLSASEHVVIVSSDTKGIIQNVNSGCEKLLGYTAEELIGKTDPSIFHSPEHVATLEAELALIHGKKVKLIDALIAEVVEADGPISRDLIYYSKFGERLEMLLTVSPIKSNGELIGFLGIAIDTSDIKKAEKEIKELLLVSEDQNARLKNFAHIVSHNLRSHSGNIGFLMDLLIEEHPELKEEEIVPMLARASSNLTQAIDHLSDVAIVNTSLHDHLQQIDLAQSVDKVISNVEALAIKEDLEIINEVSKPSYVLGIHAYLESIVLNFLTNAIKYAASSRKSWVKIRTEIDKDYLLLSFEDNGLGIDLGRHGEKIFGMYKTFHEHKESRGIGLFIAKSQIEALGGKVEVESEVNKGSTFKIYLKYD